MKRRAVLAGLPSALLLGGCTDLITGNEAQFEADRGIVSESTLSDTDYEEQSRDEQTIERNFDNVDRTVVVINKMTEYSRSVDIPLSTDGELARFTVLATPKIDIVPGRPANPVGDMDNDELAERVQNQYDSVENVEQVGEREVELLGETVTVSKYEADAQTEGEGAEINLHIAQGESEDDFIIGVGAHPTNLDEDDRVNALLEGVTHPA